MLFSPLLSFSLVVIRIVHPLLYKEARPQTAFTLAVIVVSLTVAHGKGLE
jgi:hypothetical protein